MGLLDGLCGADDMTRRLTGQPHLCAPKGPRRHIPPSPQRPTQADAPPVDALKQESTAPIVSLALYHEAALAGFLADFRTHGEARIPAWFPGDGWPHARKVEALHNWSAGLELSEGWVPCTTRFLQDDDGQLIGVVNVRHLVTPQLHLRGGHVGVSVRPSHRRQGHGQTLLRWALKHCRLLGIPNAWLTTSAHNIASQRVIEACGGVERGRRPHPEDGENTVHYAVPTTPSGA